MLFVLSELIVSSGKILVLLTSYQLGLTLLVMVSYTHTHHCGFEKKKVLGLALSTKVPRLVAHVDLLSWR